MLTAKSPAIKRWLDHQIEVNPPRAKSVVMTLFGDVIAPHGGQVWLGCLIELLAPFGINDRLVRTSVFRLAEEGWLDAQREGRRSRYLLNPSSAHRFERAYQRIYTPPYRQWKGTWTLLLATSSTFTAEERANLRKELLWEGFGLIAPSVFGHPNANSQTVEEILKRVGVEDRVFVCDAVESKSISTRPLRDLVSQCWDLESVSADYDRFIQCFAALPKLLSARKTVAPEQAFAIRTLLIHEFRRVQLHDQQLPLELLPENWPGKTAYELCSQIYRSTYEAADQHVLNVLKHEDDAVPESAPYFYQRVGGLVSP